jgi:hypothetical protein
VKIKLLPFAALALLLPAGVQAQVVLAEPDPSTFRMHLGPLGLTPTIALTNAGVDTNVFYTATNNNPQSDFTFTLTPQTPLYLRMGGTWLVGNVKEGFVWFDKFADQRSWNQDYTLGWLVPLPRMSFDVGGNYVNTHDRPGFEIDARPQHFETAVNGALEIRALAKTYFGVTAERRKIDYGAFDYFGVNLQSELTRTATTEVLTARYRLTPLTNITFGAGEDQERFEYLPLTDSNSRLYTATVSFDPAALINGSAQIGYRTFKPLSAELQGYSGSTASVNLSYTALESTKMSATVTRDIQYSYDINTPYYLQTGVTATLTQEVYGPLDLQGRIGAQRLAYIDRIGAVVAVANRVDHVQSYGGGAGYRLSRDIRLGLNIDQQKRTSELTNLQYNDLQIGIAITVGR